jgi:hypothetical protein
MKKKNYKLNKMAEFLIRVNAEKDNLTWVYEGVIGPGGHYWCVGLMIKGKFLDKFPDHIKEMLSRGMIENGGDLKKALDITIYLGDHPRASFASEIVIRGDMDKKDINKLIESSILEEAIETIKNDYIRHRAEFNYAKL